MAKDSLIAGSEVAFRSLPKISIRLAGLFSVAMAVVYSPNLLEVFAIHNGYEMLDNNRIASFFHPEAEHLLSIGRPLAALLTNVTVLPIRSLADLQWGRLFSLLSLCVLGVQYMAICINRLDVKSLHALCIAVATFTTLSWIYSVLDPSAWTSHFLTTMVSLGSYSVLSRANVQALPFLVAWGRRDHRLLIHQVWAYSLARPVLIAGLIYQLALYTYPPYALMLMTLPVIGILFSQRSRSLRTLIAARDVCFVGANLILYILTIKLVYLPIAGLFTSVKTSMPTDNPFVARLTSSYQFTFNTDPSEIIGRLGRIFQVAGDLWFLPQTQMHVFVGALLVFVLLGSSAAALLLPRLARAERTENSVSILRLQFGHAEGLVVLMICFAVASSTVLLSAAGLITYRTVAIATAIVGITLIFAVRCVVYSTWNGLGGSLPTAARVSDAAMVLVVCAALAGSFYANYATMILSRNEFAYFSWIVRQAVDNNSKTIFIVDRRPFSLPDDHPMLYDRQGRAIPPYELGCFSGFCLQTGSIVRIAASELGHSPSAFAIMVPRGAEPVPGLTCSMLTSLAPSNPPNATERMIDIINYYRAQTPLTCADYSLVWHDLGADIGRWRRHK